MAFLSGLLRRLLGGWLSTVSFIKERGTQWVLGILLYGTAIYCKASFLGGYDTWLFDWLNVWLFIVFGAVSVVWCMTKGHFPGFMCGTESLDYINEQLSNGRKISFQKVVDWIMSKRGLEQYGKEWCFWHLMINKTVYSLIPALFFGYQFVFIGIAVALAYNAMFWVELKPFKKILTSPTNWGEFWQGYFIMWGIL